MDSNKKNKDINLSNKRINKALFIRKTKSQI